MVTMNQKQINKWVTGGPFLQGVSARSIPEYGYFLMFYFSINMYSAVELTTARKELKTFKSLDSVAKFLSEMNIHKFEVEL